MLKLRDCKALKKFIRGAAAVGFGITAGAIFLMPSGTETAEANGDTRTISLYHSHTGESIDATFRVNGHYDPAVLDKLNWFLRDWRTDQPTKMDPRLFDVVWETYRAAGADQPIVVFSAYRSPETNAMLRRRSHSVAEYSQHMLGKAMDTTMPGMSMEKIREFGMRMQRGGVGYYPSSNFVHLDVGSVRHWPRMSYDQLARLFPDGKTVHIPSNGQPLARFAEARAEIEANGGAAAYVPEQNSKGFFAWLFGSHDEREEAESVPRGRMVPARGGRTQVANLQNANSSISSIAPRGSMNSEEEAERAGNRPVKSLLPDQRNGEASLTQTGAIPPARVKGETRVASLAPPSQGAELPALVKQGGALTSFPLPPSRPSELMASFADVPVPPTRPLAYAELPSNFGAAGSSDRDNPDAKPLSRTDPINRLLTDNAANAKTNSLLRAANLPVIITAGSAKGTEQGVARDRSQVLAYAATPQMQGLRSAANAKVAISEAVSAKAGPLQKGETSVVAKASAAVPARLDRSNFHSLIATTTLANASAQPGVGPTGLRPSARATASIFANTPSAGYVTAFSDKASDLETQHFSGKAVEALAANRY